MYIQDKSLFLRDLSPAYSPNLQAWFEDNNKARLIVTLRSSLNILTSSSVKAASATCEQMLFSETSDHRKVLQARIVKIDKLLVIVVLYSNGIQIYSADDYSLIGYLPFVKLDSLYGYDALSSHSSGVAVFHRQIWIGHTMGLFGLTLNSNSIDVSKFIPQNEGIIDVYSNNDDYMISCGKQLTIWNWQNTLNQLVQFNGLNSEQFLHARIYKSLVLTALSSGFLQLYSIKEKRLLSQVVAHCKWIIAIDISQENGIALSASEDTMIQIWQLQEIKNEWIIHRQSIHVPNSLLVGACFLDSWGNKIAAIAYDSDEIHCFFKN